MQKTNSFVHTVSDHLYSKARFMINAVKCRLHDIRQIFQFPWIQTRTRHSNSRKERVLFLSPPVCATLIKRATQRLSNDVEFLNLQHWRDGICIVHEQKLQDLNQYFVNMQRYCCHGVSFWKAPNQGINCPRGPKAQLLVLIDCLQDPGVEMFWNLAGVGGAYDMRKNKQKLIEHKWTRHAAEESPWTANHEEL